MESGETIQEPVQVSGGDSITTFDDLERVTESSIVKDKRAESQPFEALDSKPKKEKDDESEKSAKSEKSTKSKEEKVSKKTEEPPKDEAAKLAKDKEVIKNFKLKNGEAEVEVPAEAMVPVKINGKTEMVKLQEVVNGYSGQSALDRQFSSFKKERDTFVQQRELADEAVKSLYDLAVNKKDLRGFIDYIAGAYGQDGAKIFDELVGPLKSQAEELASLTPEERQAKQTAEELEYYRKREQAIKERTAKAKEQSALEAATQKIMSDYGIDQPTFLKRFDELKQLGSIKPEEITPEIVAKYHQNISTIETVEKVLSEVAPELENKDSEIERISTYALQVGAGPAEIEEVVKTLYANQAERKLSRKIEKMQRKSGGETPVKDPQKDPLFFGDLE